MRKLRAISIVLTFLACVLFLPPGEAADVKRLLVCKSPLCGEPSDEPPGDAEENPNTVFVLGPGETTEQIAVDPTRTHVVVNNAAQTSIWIEFSDGTTREVPGLNPEEVKIPAGATWFRIRAGTSEPAYSGTYREETPPR